MLKAHVIMDVFTAKPDFKKAKISDLINYIVFFFPLILALTYTTLRRALKSYSYNERIYSGWRPIVWPVQFLVVGCYAILLLQGISEIIKDIVSLQKGSDEWIKDR
jgi:TRAP-type mannitol/chloroaromatic compound transport system permease small subunit